MLNEPLRIVFAELNRLHFVIYRGAWAGEARNSVAEFAGTYGGLSDRKPYLPFLPLGVW